MTDLIDRREFDKELEDVIVVASAKLAQGEGPQLVNELTIDYLSQVRKWLQEAPAVEAVPVIHCRDCVNARTYDSGEVYCELLYSSDWDPEVSPDTDYCSFAERKKP